MIAALLANLGVHNERLPPFGATVIFELHDEPDQSNSAESNRIRMVYLNESFYHLQMAECQDPCTVERFVSIIAPLSLSRDEFDKKCKLDHS